MMFAVAVMDPTIKMLFYAGRGRALCIGGHRIRAGQGLVRRSRLGRVAFPFFWDALAEV